MKFYDLGSFHSFGKEITNKHVNKSSCLFSREAVNIFNSSKELS